MNRILYPRVSPLFLGSERAAEMYVDELVDGAGRVQYLDKVASVSGAIEIETDCDYDPTHNELNEFFVHPSSVEVCHG